MKRFLRMLVWVLLAGSVAASDFDSLIDKMADVYGGRTKLEEIVAVRETGRVEAAMSTGTPRPMVRTFARPLKLRVEIGEPSKPSEVRIVDGPKGWRNGKESAGMGYEAMVLQAARLDLPFQLLSHRKSLVEKEQTDFEGKRLRVVELPLEKGLSITAGIEAQTGRILLFKGTTKAGPEGPMTFETRYDDFRTVEGRLFAFKETNFAGGTKTADIILSKFELLKAEPTGVFSP